MSKAFELVRSEMVKQDKKWGSNRKQPDYVWLLILVEEIGEVAEAILNNLFKDGPINDVDMEVTQTTAVGMQWLKTKTQEGGNGPLRGEGEQLTRLRLISELSPKCSWHKYEFLCDENEREGRKLYRNLMNDCANWEKEMGL